MSQTPMEDAIREKITTALNPTELEIHNDSHLHAHHAAMKNNQSAETHFRVVVASEAFSDKGKMEKHRMVYRLLKDEMSMAGGIHSLQLTTKDPAKSKSDSVSVTPEKTRDKETIDALVKEKGS